MIPKIIHYCWFGRNPLPESAIKCINSWKKFFPDYEIKEWNEDNFDVNMIPYTHEAYEAKKYAFVSDYARMWVLYHYGGLYFDTDVEVIKSMDDIVARGPFMGIEVDDMDGVSVAVNPGLGLGTERGLSLYREILDYYSQLHFVLDDGKFNNVAIVRITSQALVNNGLSNDNMLQKVANVWVYPSDFFNPLDDRTGVLKITKNTRSVHWYTKTWMKKQNPLLKCIVRLIHRYIGCNSLKWLKQILKK